MSIDVGKELPQDLFDALSNKEPANQVGKAIVVSTVDSLGWSHPALLSYREVSARVRDTIRLVTYSDSNTTANMRDNGKVTLVFIDDRMNYYVKGTASEVRAERAEGFATMDLAIHHILADSPGADEAGSFITSGITYRDPEE